MRNDRQAAREAQEVHGAVVLVATTLVQALCSAAMLLVPTVAPQMAASLGLSITLLGFQMSLLYCVAMLVSAQAGAFVRSIGGCRTSQYAMLFAGTGCLVIMLASPAALLLGTLALGVSYGLTNPAAAHLLTRFTAARQRNLVFSIKQTGVPLGGIIAGIGAPPLTQWFGWPTAFATLALIAVVTAVLMQPMRARWDDDRRPGARAAGSGALRVLRASRTTMWLGLVGCCLAAGQLSLLTYLVAFMVEELLIGLVVAGLVMSAVHLSGVCGRIAWGVIADRIGSSIAVLSGLAVAMIVLFSLVASVGPGWPLWLVVAIFAATGGTAVGWNGVYLAAVAQRNAPEMVGEATGAVLVLTYLGVLIGPAVFAVVLTASGSYSAGFLLPAGFAALSLVCLAMCSRAARAERHTVSEIA